MRTSILEIKSTGTRSPDRYEFGQNFKHVIDTDCLMGIDIFHGYIFRIAKPNGFCNRCRLLGLQMATGKMPADTRL
jgi:hypothetical protein